MNKGISKVGHFVNQHRQKGNEAKPPLRATNPVPYDGARVKLPCVLNGSPQLVKV